jgi:hypothetical protein
MIEIIRRGELVGSKRPLEDGGGVFLKTSLGEWDIQPSDRLWIEYGGLSAAVGYVPITGLRERHGTRTCVYSDGVDTYISNDDPDVLLHDAVAVFEAVAKEAGARYISLEEQYAERQRRDEEKKARRRLAADAFVNARPGETVFAALSFELGNSAVIRGARGEIVAINVGINPSEAFIGTLQRTMAPAVDVMITDNKNGVNVITHALPMKKIIDPEIIDDLEFDFGEIRLLAREKKPAGQWPSRGFISRIHVDDLVVLHASTASSTAWDSITPADMACDVLLINYSVKDVQKLPARLHPPLVIVSPFDAGAGWEPRYLVAHYRGAGDVVSAAGVALVKSRQGIHLIGCEHT